LPHPPPPTLFPYTTLFRSDLIETVAEDGQAGRHGVTAKTAQQRGAVSQAVNQMKSLDAPRRAAPFVAIGVEDKRRTVKLFHQLASRQAEHAERPVGGAHHDHRRCAVE